MHCRRWEYESHLYNCNGLANRLADYGCSRQGKNYSFISSTFLPSQQATKVQNEEESIQEDSATIYIRKRFRLNFTLTSAFQQQGLLLYLGNNCHGAHLMSRKLGVTSPTSNDNTSNHQLSVYDYKTTSEEATLNHITELLTDGISIPCGVSPFPTDGSLYARHGLSCPGKAKTRAAGHLKQSKSQSWP